MIVQGLSCAAILTLWVAAVIDPIGNFFGLRFIALALSFFTITVLFFTDRIIFNELRNFCILIISILMPIYGLVICIFRGGLANLIDTSYISAGILLTTSLLYFNKELCAYGIKAMIISLRALSFLILFIACTEILNVNNNWFEIFMTSNVALISFREYSYIKLPYIYFLSSPMLIYIIAYDLNNFKSSNKILGILKIGISILALILSGTRAHILIGIIYLPVYLFMMNPRNNKFLLFLSVILFFVLLLFIDDFRNVLSEFFSAYETNNGMKISMLSNYSRIFDDSLTLIFGQGYNAHEWSQDLIQIIAMEDGASKTELTFIEIFRVGKLNFA